MVWTGKARIHSIVSWVVIRTHISYRTRTGGSMLISGTLFSEDDLERRS